MAAIPPRSPSARAWPSITSAPRPTGCRSPAWPRPRRRSRTARRRRRWGCSSGLAAQRPSGLVEAGEGQREHAVVHQLADDLGRGGVVPILLRRRVEPYCARIGVGEPLHPDRARFLVEMLDRAARMGDLVGAHRGVADEDELPVVAELVEHVPGRGPLREAAAIVLPQALIGAIVEVEEFEVLELGRRGGEQFLAEPDVRVHRAADVEEEEQLHRIVPLGAHLDVEPALARGAVDRAVHVELLGGALAGEAAEPPQRDLDVPPAELDRGIEVPELALVPDLDRQSVAPALLADPDAFRIVTVGAERRGSRGPDPLAPALVPPLLLLEPLLQRLHDLFPRAERADLLHLLGGEIELGDLPQPVLGDRHGLGAVFGLEPLEDLAE